MHKSAFALWSAAIFVASYLILSSLDMVPVELSEANYRAIHLVGSLTVSTSVESDATAVVSAQRQKVQPTVKEQLLPERIMINKIGIDASVMNPETRDPVVLDQALLEGVVRYPGSGGLDDDSNMFLFGHSTGYQTVRNQVFKSLNRLGELQIGDTISVVAEGSTYQYKVILVSQVDKDEALVEFTTGKKMLTLSTCDSFGEKSDRFVVKAEFVQSLPSTTLTQ